MNERSLGAIVPRDEAALKTEIERLEQVAQDLEQHFRADNTKLAYGSAFRDFTAWCLEHRFSPLPATPQTVRLYIGWCVDARTKVRPPTKAERARGETEPKEVPARLKLASVQIRLSAIAMAHWLRDLDSPTNAKPVKIAWESARRAHARDGKSKPKRAFLGEDLRALVRGLGGRPIDVRDRAILLNGFLGGFRRSELAGLTYEDLVFEPRGIVVTLQTSKTNQRGEVERVLIARDPDPAIDPVFAIEHWLQLRGREAGPLWSGHSNRRQDEDLGKDGAGIYKMVRRRVVDALVRWLTENLPAGAHPELRFKNGGWVRSRFTDAVLTSLVKGHKLPPTLDPRNYGAHSLRSGLVTTARMDGRPDHAIRRQTRHKSSAMLDRYTHSLAEWVDNVSKGLL
jgi:integrase